MKNIFKTKKYIKASIGTCFFMLKTLIYLFNIFL